MTKKGVEMPKECPAQLLKATHNLLLGRTARLHLLFEGQPHAEDFAEIFLNKMKVLLLITAILAVAAGFPVPQDLVSGSNESPSQFYVPPYPFPFGPYYIPFLYQGHPWFPPQLVPIPLSEPTISPPSGE
ncbi:follicular dendritic cell secreted peptide isoform X2 [Hyaena hyaena]|uniref:follicular dendritic cell secreted peptide isoform X2 n=1 Tax=Hyaena hyaena TaxID=95912 RepID=UPI0019219A84|nr:follicular dendritic cell secreted peptide isoform X2 [Hyaena hyaena]